MEVKENLNHLPRHVAIIMDGNGRWAKQQGLPRLIGHRQGVITAQHVVEVFIKYQIPYLTLYAFSTENWNRPKIELDGLYKILKGGLNEWIKFALAREIKVRHLGKLEGLPLGIREKISKALELTRDNTGLTLSLAFNYGGRDEIIEATRRLLLSGIPAQNIDEATISQYLYTADIPDPDLVIRTGGEMRLSNFLTWQTVYAELHFTSAMWPDFNEEEIEKALISYSQRQRRFGDVLV